MCQGSSKPADFDLANFGKAAEAREDCEPQEYVARFPWHNPFGCRCVPRHHASCLTVHQALEQSMLRVLETRVVPVM